VALEEANGSRAASGAARTARIAPAGEGRGTSSPRSRRPAALLPLLDFAVVAGAAAVGYVARFGWVVSSGAIRDLAVALALPITWVIAGVANGAYDRRFLGAGTTEFRRVGRTFLTVLALIASVSYVADLQIARGLVMPAVAGSLLAVCAARCLARLQLVRRRRAGEAMQRIVVVGRAASLRALAATLRREPSAGLQVIGACLPEDEALDAGLCKALAEAGVPVLGALGHVRDVVLHNAADGVAVVGADVSSRAIRSISWELEDIGAELIVSTGLTDVAT
jgi:FlaA1/EpsC-like NDP-sugar epimerase